MNERIRELAEQATRIEEPDGLVPREVFDREKFAKLILSECIAVLNRPKSAMEKKLKLSQYNEGWVNGRILGIEHIKEHFGVEE